MVNAKSDFKRKLTKRYGKVIDVSDIWLDQRKYPVEIRLRKNSENEFDYTMVYVAEPPTTEDSYDMGILDVVSDTDVNELGKKMEEALQKRYDIMWRDMILLTVDKPRLSAKQEEGASVSIGIQRYQEGLRQFDGTKCYRLMHYRPAIYNEEAVWVVDEDICNEESPARESGWHRHEHHGTIEYTDENWQKLLSIVSAMEVLRLRAIELLTGAALKDNLLEMNMTKLLESPK